MPLNRRRFLGLSGLGTLSLFSSSFSGRQAPASPVVVSTWAQNTGANRAAWAVLQRGGSALDAVVAGVAVPEADPRDTSVGYGGLPDRDGRVTLDACVMNEKGQCGSVMFLQGIMHPAQVARLVMEKTPHVQLVGEGALAFAIQQGFKVQNLLTPESEKAWKAWLASSKYDPMTTIDELMRKSVPPPGGPDNHDTIGSIALDQGGRLSGACSTSGMAYKMHGRVGDSPIIGAGLFVDNEVGAATATGVGEEMVRICASHTIVEAMRQGLSPEAACKRAVERIVRRNGTAARNLQAGFIALRKDGAIGAYATMKGFTYAIHSAKGPKVLEAKSWYS